MRQTCRSGYPVGEFHYIALPRLKYPTSGNIEQSIPSKMVSSVPWMDVTTEWWMRQKVFPSPSELSVSIVSNGIELIGTAIVPIWSGDLQV